MSSVVVVGGGVAGLVCAWRLRRAGHDVEVLEAGSEPGGRMRTEVCGEFAVDFATPSLADRSPNLRGVAAALGIADRLQAFERSRRGVYRAGGFHSSGFDSPFDFATTRLVSAGSKLRLARRALRRVADWRRLDRNAEALDDRDFSTTAAVEDDCLRYVLDPLVTELGGRVEELSWPAGLIALRDAVASGRPCSFSRGSGLLTQTLAGAVPVRLECVVTRIETQTEGVRVRYTHRGRSGRVIADAVVVAVPGSQVAALCPKLTPDERGFFEQVRYERGVVVAIALDTAPRDFGFARVSFPAGEGVGLRTLRFDHHRPGAVPRGSGLIVAELERKALERHWDASDEQVADFAVEQLAKTPLGRVRAAQTIVRRFSFWAPVFAPGSLRSRERFAQRMDRSPRIAFAGDYLLGNTAEAALTSGTRAATTIARTVTQPS